MTPFEELLGRKMPLHYDYIREFWPKGELSPTDAEIDAADMKYRERVAKNDVSDFGCGLTHLVATTAPWCWGEYFGKSWPPPTDEEIRGWMPK